MKLIEHYCIHCGSGLKDLEKICKKCGFRHLQSPPTRAKEPNTILNSVLIGYLGLDGENKL